MSKLVGFSTLMALPEEQVTERIRRRILSGDQGMLVWWSIEAGVHVEPHNHPNEQIVWMLEGAMEFRLGTEQRVCRKGDVLVVPGGVDHEAWFREDTEVSRLRGTISSSAASPAISAMAKHTAQSLVHCYCATTSAARLIRKQEPRSLYL